ncbi:unnamed protein product, partial [Polarella glacialis]
MFGFCGYVALLLCVLACLELLSGIGSTRERQAEEDAVSSPEVLWLCPGHGQAHRARQHLDRVGAPLGVVSHEACGDAPIASDRAALAEAGSKLQILLGTPGRVLSLLREGAFHLGQLSRVVVQGGGCFQDDGCARDVRAIVDEAASPPQLLVFGEEMLPDARRRCQVFLSRGLGPLVEVSLGKGLDSSQGSSGSLCTEWRHSDGESSKDVACSREVLLPLGVAL